MEVYTMSYRLGIDIGGTFTDFILIDQKGNVTVHKSPSTPSNPEQGVLTGLKDIANKHKESVEEFLPKVELLSHGSTISTNTVIERDGPKLGLIHTEGFRDIMILRDGHKRDRYNLHMPPPDPFVPRYLRKTVRERILYTGEIQTALDEDSVRDVCSVFKKEGVKAVAVSLLWSIINPIHEQRVKEIINEELPDVHVEISSDVSPSIREYPRTGATVLSAYTAPALGEYMTKIDDYLHENGFRYRMQVMQCTGGSSSVEEVKKKSVHTIGSGPAGGPLAALYYGETEGDKDLMVCDMGGTSFDVSLIRNGVLPMSTDMEIQGIPIGIGAVDVHSIGAGGGSIAWVDAGGALRVGPKSAGSEPGPACYCRGGEEPAVTDANLMLGYLNPDYFVGGEMKVDKKLAEQALKKISDQLDTDVINTASAIFRIVNSNMVHAMREVSVMRGIDPRTYTLVSGGAAGGTHAAKIAEELGMKKVLCPVTAGGICAFGLLSTDVRHDYLTSDPMSTSKINIERVNNLYKQMEAKAKEDLLNEGYKPEDIILRRSVDAKYPIQLHEIKNISIKHKGEIREADVSEIAEAFHKEHERLYTYSLPHMPVDINGWRLIATGKIPDIERIGQDFAGSNASEAIKSTRKVYFDDGFRDTDIYDGEKLKNGMTFNGPAVVELPTTTLLVFPNHSLRVNQHGDFVINIP